MTIKDVTGRLARWSLFIQQFDFDIKHRPGITNGNADGLSRQPYNITSLAALNHILSFSVENIVEMQKKDSDLAPMITYMATKTLPNNEELSRFIFHQHENFYLDQKGLLYHVWSPTGQSRTATKSLLAIPGNLPFDILKTFHDNSMEGHLGHEKTYDKIGVHYYWSGMYKDIQHWVRSCVDCQMRKTPRNRKRAPSLPIPVELAFDRATVDCLRPFPNSYSGNRYVVVFSDYLKRWPGAFAVSTVDAVVIAKLLVKTWNRIIVSNFICLLPIYSKTVLRPCWTMSELT